VFLEALIQRERPNKTKQMSTIIFIRDKNSKGQEISGYIDFADRLAHEDFTDYFTGRKRLLPRPSDLSFYNWEANTCCYNTTTYYEVIVDYSLGLLFKCTADRKIINVDPKGPHGDNTTRTPLMTTRYKQVVFYDHCFRKRV
jgi:hypothetical protein